ncbi:hypothetical protein CRG98_034207 [Punica granatum]|uniref:Uncharacterized protein n=1 Tax=Punica granatum TaxID=22663 RepID=A0A2I0IN18_PUNGR|nr:hypothetical protein CRG98_034207 [Punica granatum]
MAVFSLIWNCFKHYLCPATGQHFYTYEDMMRYVTYAKLWELSIYAPDFEAKRKGKPRNKHLGKQSSKSAMKEKHPAAPPKKRARPGLLPVKPNFSADDDDMNLGLTCMTDKENQAGENSTDSDSDPDDLPYEKIGKQSSKSAMEQKHPAAPPKKKARPGLCPVKPKFSAEDDDDMSLGLTGMTDKEDQASENSSDSDTDPDDPPYETTGKQSSRSAMRRKHPVAPPKKQARSDLPPVKPKFSAEDDDMSLGLSWMTYKEDQARENSSDSDSDPDDPPYETAAKQSFKSSMKQKHPAAPPKKRARPDLLPVKPNFSAEDDDMSLGLTWIIDKEDHASENSSDSDSDPDDPPYETTAKRSLKSAMKQKHPAAPPKKGARPDLLPVKPKLSDEDNDMSLSLTWMADKEDQASENSSDSDSDSDDPPYETTAKRRFKSAVKQKHRAAPPKKRARPDLLPVKPNFSAEYDDMSPGITRMTNKEDRAGENSSDSDSESDPDDPPYDPRIEATSSSRIRSEPDSPKIILYERRSKLKKRVGGRNLVKIGRQ